MEKQAGGGRDRDAAAVPSLACPVTVAGVSAPQWLEGRQQVCTGSLIPVSEEREEGEQPLRWVAAYGEAVHGGG